MAVAASYEILTNISVYLYIYFACKIEMYLEEILESVFSQHRLII